ncbi:MAG: hypothetical protein ACJ8OJ_16805 [Povalibacter sp.]
MRGWLWVAFALLVCAVLVRAQGGHRRAAERAYLALLSLAVCLAIDIGISGSRVNAAEEAASTGRQIQPTLATSIEGYYDPVLLPLYVAIVMVLADLLARLVRHLFVKRHISIDRKVLWLSASANALLLVAAPALIYLPAVRISGSSSILNDAASESLRPFVAAYGVPSYWTSSCFGTCEPTLSSSASRPWSWSRYYTLHGRMVDANFMRDSGPWWALSLLLACIVELSRRGRSSSRRLIQYFVSSKSSDTHLPPTSAAWRARVFMVIGAIVATMFVGATGAVYLIAYLAYVLLAVVVSVVVLTVVWLCNLRR